MIVMIAFWDQRLSVGDPVVDAEHKQVLDLLNELDVAMKVGAPDVVVETALGAMTRTVNRHFSRDGEAVGPHADFIVQVYRVIRDWRRGGRQPVQRRELLDLAGRWIDHIGRRETPRAPVPPMFPTATIEGRPAGP